MGADTLNPMAYKTNRFRCWLAILLTAASLPAVSAQAGDWGVNVYGLSYHWDRSLAKQKGRDNEFNPGLGFRYHMGSWLKADGIIDAGAYHDSARNTAVYAGAGLLWPLDKNKHFNAGIGLVAFHSDTYNDGDPFITPAPLFSLSFEKFSINLTHFPKINSINPFNTTALYFTFFLP
jgi:Antimicrobial peptide resistance and lipid A acylation protein PagP